MSLSPPAPRTGGLGGFGAGCNWQTQQWVYGVEGDVDVGHIAGSQTNSVGGTFGSTITVAPTGLTFIGSPTATATENSEINWLSSIRGRVGFAVLDRLLLFATGGLAISEARSDGSVTVTNTDIISHTVAQQIIWSGSHSEVKAGFVVGGGAEWAFADRWTVKAEYLYYDLGNVSHPLACSGGTISFGATNFSCNSTPGIFPTLGSAVTSLHVNVVRFGINYRFN